MNKCCETCKWYDDVTGMCYNWKSPHFAGKTDQKQRCCEWERKGADNEATKND